MKLKNSEVFSASTGLQELSTESFPIAFSWKIATAADTLKPFVTRLMESQGKLNEKYAMRDEAGNMIPTKNESGEDVPGTLSIPGDKIQEWNTEVLELMNQEIDVSNNVQLALTDFPTDYRVSPATVNNLRPIITQ